MVATEPRSLAELRDRRALVLGFARSGVALARMLAAAGARVTVYDRRSAAEVGDALGQLGGADVELALGAAPEMVERLIGESDLIFTSPSISPVFPTTDAWLRAALRRAESAGTPVLSEVELFLRLTGAKTVGVTGTKGKTTTTALIGAILEAGGVPHAVGGNIGTPLIERVEELGPDDWAVIELSELQLPTISRGVDVAVYTNILEDHLDRHSSVAAYRAVKARLAELAPPGGAVVLNADDPASRELADRVARETAVHLYGHAAPRDAAGLAAWTRDGWLVVGDAGEPGDAERVIAVADVPLPGDHMLANVLAAALAARLVGVPSVAVAAGIRDFRGVAHRLETVAEIDGVRYVNDSQATIPIAAIAALRAFDGSPVVLIAGGRGKNLDYGALADVAAARCRAAVLMGETADELEAAFAGRVPVARVEDMDAAVAAARRIALPGDVVVLAPAAASFDMFVDYAARGDAFRRAVERLRTDA